MSSWWIIGSIVLACWAAHAQEAERNALSVIRCTLEAAQSSLPCEPVGIRMSLLNESDADQIARDHWKTTVTVGEIKDGEVEWRVYVPSREPIRTPPALSSKVFEPHEVKRMIIQLDYEHPGRPVFSRSGEYWIKVNVGSYTCEPMRVEVRQPRGIDNKAHQVVARTDLGKYFSEWTVRKYSPCPAGTVQALERFSAEFAGSRYSDLARLGAGLICLTGGEGEPDLDKAIAYFDMVTRSAHEDLAARARFHLGQAFVAKGETAKAREEYRIALSMRIDPYHKHRTEQAQSEIK
jgi:hypothetical protein